MSRSIATTAVLLAALLAGPASGEQPVQEAPRVVMRSVTFPFDGAAVAPLSLPGLRLVADWMQENPEARLRIVGYTCELGAEVYNQSLSYQRALSVRSVLVELGVDEDRLDVSGRGEADPIAANGTPEGRALNRRVEFVVVRGADNVRTVEES